MQKLDTLKARQDITNLIWCYIYRPEWLKRLEEIRKGEVAK